MTKQFTCLACRKPFTQFNGNQRYCSKQCGYKARNTRARYKKLTTRQCSYCSQDFQPTHGRERYCTPTCRIDANRPELKLYVDKVCVNCNTSFSTHITTHKYCCERCNEQARSRRKGSDNKNFIKKSGCCAVCSLSILEALEAHHYSSKDRVVLCGTCHNIWHRVSKQKYADKDYVIYKIQNTLLNHQRSLTKEAHVTST